MVIAAPCSNGKGLVWLDVLAATQNALGALIVWQQEEDQYSGVLQEERSSSRPKTGGMSPESLVLFVPAAGFLFSALKGNDKVNECRAFRAELIQRSRDRASSLTSYKWLDELFPVPDLVANAFDPVFGGSISNTPKH